MIIGKQNLLEWFRIQNKPNFSIFRKNKEESGNVLYTNKNRESETMETALAFLDKCLGLISSGDFFIYCHATEATSSKGRSETHFSLSSSDSVAGLQSNVQHTINGINGAFDYETMMKKASEIAEQKFEQLQNKKDLEDSKKKLSELEKENKELTQNLQRPWNKLLGEASPYIGSIFEQLGLKKAGMAAALPISGVAHDEVLEDNDTATTDQEIRMNNAVHAFVSALANQYPDKYINIIEQLTATIKNSPEKIDMALTFL
jgi:hypothetical protein